MDEKTLDDWLYGFREQLNEVAEEMCDNYCKYKDQYKDYEWDYLYETGKIPCEGCPLMKIVS